MKKRLAYALASCGAVALAAGAVFFGCTAGPRDLADATPVNRLPQIRPDYAGCVIPPNIAPLNFLVEEPAAQYHVRISSKRGEGIEISGSCSEHRNPLEAVEKTPRGESRRGTSF